MAVSSQGKPFSCSSGVFPLQLPEPDESELLSDMRNFMNAVYPIWTLLTNRRNFSSCIKLELGDLRHDCVCRVTVLRMCESALSALGVLVLAMVLYTCSAYLRHHRIPGHPLLKCICVPVRYIISYCLHLCLSGRISRNQDG